MPIVTRQQEAVGLRASRSERLHGSTRRIRKIEAVNPGLERVLERSGGDHEEPLMGKEGGSEPSDLRRRVLERRARHRIESIRALKTVATCGSDRPVIAELRCSKTLILVLATGDEIDERGARPSRV